MVITCPVALFCTVSVLSIVVVVVVVLDYDNSCDNLLRLCCCSKSFVLQIIHAIHDVMSVQRACCRRHLATKNIVPEL
jgi:hypothetical protein